MLVAFILNLTQRPSKCNTTRPGRGLGVALAAGWLMVVGLGVAGPLPAAVAQSSTILVPAQQPTIQAAIDAASAGDTVVVAPGTYTGGINFDGKAITVKSAAGASTTTIMVQDGPDVIFHNGESTSSILEGFTLSGSKAPSGGGADGGVVISDASPLVLGNVITADDGCTGAGIDILGGSPIIDGNVVTHNLSNQCQPSMGAIYSLDSQASIVLNVVAYNNLDGIVANDVDSVGPADLILDNLVVDNQGNGILAGSNTVVAQNLVVGNLAGIGAEGSAQVVNNTVANNITAPLTISGSGSVVNNVLVGPFAQSPLQCYQLGTPAPTISHNDMWSPWTPQTSGGCPTINPADGNVSANPDLTASFQLAPGSPAIGAGTLLAPFLFTTDLALKPRTVNGKVDMGAFESQAGEPIAAIPPPTVLNVPAEFPTIQPAIDAATDGEEILVAPGTYVGALNFEGKSIILASSGGPKLTTLEDPGLSAGVTFDNGESRAAVLEGFSLENDAISIANASPSIIGNVINVDTTTTPAAIQLQGAPLILGNVFYGTVPAGVNTASAIAGESYGGAIISNVIVDAGTAVNLDDASPVLVVDNVFADNGAGFDVTYLGQSDIIQNIFAANDVGVDVVANISGALERFSNNTFIDNKEFQASVPSLASYIFTNNVLEGPDPIECQTENAAPLLTDNDLDPPAGSPAVGSCSNAGIPVGNISADPKFASGTFVPAAGSPLINGGTLSGILTLPTDYAGRPRVVNGAIDIGAFQH